MAKVVQSFHGYFLDYDGGFDRECTLWKIGYKHTKIENLYKI